MQWPVSKIPQPWMQCDPLWAQVLIPVVPVFKLLACGLGKQWRTAQSLGNLHRHGRPGGIPGLWFGSPAVVVQPLWSLGEWIIGWRIFCSPLSTSDFAIKKKKFDPAEWYSVSSKRCHFCLNLLMSLMKIKCQKPFCMCKTEREWADGLTGWLVPRNLC